MPFFNSRSDPSNFVVSWTGEPKADFGAFCRGYTLAAERLAKTLLTTRFSDYEAYPVAFLFRHALELSLKHAIYRAADLAAYKFVEGIEERLHNTHDLKALASAASHTLTAVFPGDEYLEQLMRRVRATSTELSAIDPESFAYRYPMRRDGSPSTAPHQVVNLGAFAQHLSDLLEELDTLHFGISAEIDIAQDASLYGAQFELAQQAFYDAELDDPVRD